MNVDPKKYPWTLWTREAKQSYYTPEESFTTLEAAQEARDIYKAEAPTDMFKVLPTSYGQDPMDKAKIKRLNELRGFLDVDSYSVNHDRLKELCKGLDSEQFSIEFEALNKQVVAFKKKYSDCYA